MNLLTLRRFNLEYKTVCLGIFNSQGCAFIEPESLTKYLWDMKPQKVHV